LTSRRLGALALLHVAVSAIVWNAKYRMIAGGFPLLRRPPDPVTY